MLPRRAAGEEDVGTGSGGPSQLRTLLGRRATSTFFAAGTVMAMNLGSQVALARVLGVGRFGVYIYTFTWMTLLVIPGKLGFDTASITFIPHFSAHNRWGILKGYHRRSTELVTLSSIVVAVITLLVILFAVESGTDLQHAFMVSLLLLPLFALSVVQEAKLRGAKRPVWSQASQFIRPALLTIFVLVWALTDRDLSATQAMFLHVIATAIGLVLGRMMLNRALPGQVKESTAEFETRDWLRTSTPMILISSMVVVMKRCDVVMLGLLSSASAAGIYAVASRASELMIFGLVATNMVANPLISEYHSLGQTAKLQKLVTNVSRISAGTTLVAMALVVFGGRFMLALFGPAFVQARTALLILGAAQVISALSGPVAEVMLMTRHQDEAARTFFFAVLLNVGLNLFLIPRYGINGAAIATGTSTVAWNLLLMVRVKQLVGIRSLAW
jgi:O-antigen/teichoic acid export membrane protein